MTQIDSKESEVYQNTYKDYRSSILDIFIILAGQLKVILIVPTILCIIAIIYVQFFVIPIYTSSTKFMSSGAGGELSQSSGLIAQFGFNIPSTSQGLKWSFTEIIHSRSMAKRILENKFNTEKYGFQKTLLDLLMAGKNKSKLGKNILVKHGVDKLISMINIEYNIETNVYTLSVNSPEAKLSAEIANIYLDELDKHLRLYNNRKAIETREFIEERLLETETDLNLAEESLKNFREKNRNIISSASLQLEQDRLIREVSVLISVFTSLKQQLETAKIDEVKELNYVVIIDPPEIPIDRSFPNKRTVVIITGILASLIGIFFVLVRHFYLNIDSDAREKINELKLALLQNRKNQG